jgi:phosphatidylinositol glycan class T
VEKDKPINVAMNYLHEFQHESEAQSSSTSGLGANTSLLSIQRTLKESSQSHGQLSVVLRNPSSTPVDAVYLETMPWIVQFYLHTLTATINEVPQPSSSSVFSNLSYIPAIPHSRPTTFHVQLRIPANSTLRLTMDVTKAFLRYTEHPPDAQRGWDLPPAIIYILDPDHPRSGNSSRGGIRMYTPTLLVDLATPDFSMPYNVIIFTCTLVAFIFGSVFNLLTRKFVVVSLTKLGTPVTKEKGGD